MSHKRNKQNMCDQIRSDTRLNCERQGCNLCISFIRNRPPNECWLHTAISRKVVRKSASDNPERYCGWFWIHCFSKKFQRMAREAMDVCLRVLKESNKSRFDSYSFRKSALIISHITFGDCRVHSFSDNLSLNSCMYCASVHAW